MSKQKSSYTHALYTIQEAGGGLYQACRVPPHGTVPEPLPAPYGNRVELRWAVREASNALYRELCLGLRPSEAVQAHGLSAEFKISSR